jgi:hypothetical protein
MFAGKANAEFGWLPLDPWAAALTGLRERCVISSSHALIMPSGSLAGDGNFG